METIEYSNVVDKAEWERGPWDGEPDKIQWKDEATGLPCLIVRGPHGALCGYVGVPSGHPWHGADYDSVSLYPIKEGEYDPDAYPSVHGGLTFADGCGHGDDPARGICHIPGKGEPDDVWWLGFDCAHSGDKSDMSYPPHCRDQTWRRNDVYRDVGYVRNEVTNLAAQIAIVDSHRNGQDPVEGLGS